MKAILWLFALVAVGLGALVGTTTLDELPAEQVRSCTPIASTWHINNYPVQNNLIVFKFQRRSDCKHYFKMSRLAQFLKWSIKQYIVRMVSLHIASLESASSGEI